VFFLVVTNFINTSISINATVILVINQATNYKLNVFNEPSESVNKPKLNCELNYITLF